MTGHGEKQKNFAACLGCTEYALVLGTNQTLCAINRLWQVQWAFPSLVGAGKMHQCCKQQRVMGWLQRIDTHSRENKVWAGLYEQMNECGLLWVGGRGQGDCSLKLICVMPSFTAYLGIALEETIIHKFLVLQANKVSLAKDTLGSSSWSQRVQHGLFISLCQSFSDSKSNATMKMHKLWLILHKPNL